MLMLKASHNTRESPVSLSLVTDMGQGAGQNEDLRDSLSPTRFESRTPNDASSPRRTGLCRLDDDDEDYDMGSTQMKGLSTWAVYLGVAPSALVNGGLGRVGGGGADRDSSIAEAPIAVCIDSDASVLMATPWR